MNKPSKNLLDLPPELMRQIVEELSIVNRNRYIYTPASRLKARKAIQNLRLTNKTLCKAASHALVPLLRIHLNESSLASASRLSANPDIASGVKTIQLFLECCPEQVANDLRLFAAFKKEQLEKVRLKYEWFLESLESALKAKRQTEARNDHKALTHGSSDGDVPTYPQFGPGTLLDDKRMAELDLYLDAQDRWNDVRAYLSRQLRVREGDDELCQEPGPLKDLFDECFARFQRHHQEQASLIYTARFATTIASIMARLPHLEILDFRDSVKQLPYHDDDDDAPHTVAARSMVDDEKIKDVLSSPLKWTWKAISLNAQVMQSSFIYPSMEATRLFCDIPVAIARANLRLRGLVISCFPMPQNADLLVPANGALHGTQAEFESGLSCLETFQYCMNNITEEYLTFAIKEGTYSFMFDYLKQFVSSRCLKNLTLYLGQFNPTSSSIATSNTDSVFCSLRTQTLENLEMIDMKLSYASLHRLISCIGHHTRLCSLRDLYLTGGSCTQHSAS